MPILNKLRSYIKAMPNLGMIIRLKQASPTATIHSIITNSKGDKEVLKNTLSIIDKINHNQFTKIFKKYKDADPYPGYSKYLDYSSHIARVMHDCKTLGLTHCNPLNILDIGAGAGYFAFVCTYYGHSVDTIDLDTTPMYNEMKEMLGIHCYTHRIEPFKPLPNLKKKFDLVTGFQTLFDRDNHAIWGIPEWEYFLTDLAKNVLKETGAIFMGINKEPSQEKWQFQKNVAYFRSKGAIIKGYNVSFPSLKHFQTGSN
jgi:2-polyprenyl-3-methyl-5-hydroxy-6-metoxy-1,4-benzoquinol methylase